MNVKFIFYKRMKSSKGSKVVDTALTPILKVCDEEECEIEIEEEDKKDDDGIKRFKSIEEFKNYYEKNKDKIDRMSTVVLNKTYKIEGYSIRKNYGVIGFRHINSNPNKVKNEKRIEVLENVVNQMVNALNSIQERLGMI